MITHALRSGGRGVRAVLLLSLFASACEDPADPEITAAFIGNWIATSFIVDGTELMGQASEFSASFGFFSDGSYQMLVGGDTGGLLCPSAPSCAEDGDFSHTGSSITLDPGTPDQMSFQWSVSGNELTVSGTLEGSPFTAVFERT